MMNRLLAFALVVGFVVVRPAATQDNTLPLVWVLSTGGTISGIPIDRGAGAAAGGDETAGIRTVATAGGKRAADAITALRPWRERENKK